MHCIQKSSFCNLNDDKIMTKEFELLSKLHHPNIIKLFTFFTSDMNFNIISEYFKEGTLDSKIRKHKIFSEKQAKYVCRQLLNAVKYLNENNLVHTDISPDIIYIKDIINEGKHELYNIKILQFGSSTINIHNTNNSLFYMAPELINNKYHKTSDIWSIGIILFQMIHDDLPFKGYKEDEIINHSLCSRPLKNLIKRMLTKNPFKRIKVEECLNHEWFTGKLNSRDNIDLNSSKSNNTEMRELQMFEEINTNLIKENHIKFKKEKNKINKNELSNKLKSSSSSKSSSGKSSPSFTSEEKSKSKNPINNIKKYQNIRKRKKLFEKEDEIEEKLITTKEKEKEINNNCEKLNKNEKKNNSFSRNEQSKKKKKSNLKKNSVINNNNIQNIELVKSYSSNIIEVRSSKSNGQRISPLLIDTIKYIKYYIQINYKKNIEEEKIKKIFDKVTSNKKNNKELKLKDEEIKATYNDLYIGYLHYIGQKRLIIDSYSDNKKLFVNLCNLINENKKNGNAVNLIYDKNDFVRILIFLKEKYFEHALNNSYQKLRKSNTNEIIYHLNEIDKKGEYANFKIYINEMKNIILKNKLKEIYLFFEYKNLIIKSIQTNYNEKKENKIKEKFQKDNINKISNTNSEEFIKNIGIKGIIRLVDKKDK